MRAPRPTGNAYLRGDVRRRARRPIYTRLLGVPLERGTVTVATIRHDAWCPTLESGVTADCICDPEIEYRRLASPRRPSE